MCRPVRPAFPLRPLLFLTVLPAFDANSFSILRSSRDFTVCTTFRQQSLVRPFHWEAGETMRDAAPQLTSTAVSVRELLGLAALQPTTRRGWGNAEPDRASRRIYDRKGRVSSAKTH